MVAVTLYISPEAERILRAEWGDLGQAAREALIIESYRQGKLSIGQCSEIFGASFAETEAFFKSRGVDIGQSLEDIRKDCDRLKGISR